MSEIAKAKYPKTREYDLFPQELVLYYEYLFPACHLLNISVTQTHTVSRIFLVSTTPLVEPIGTIPHQPREISG